MRGRLFPGSIPALLAVVLGFVAVADAADIADVPAVLQYQARVARNDGGTTPETADVEVWIYDSATLGVGDIDSVHLLYAEKQEGVSIDRGFLRLSVGEGAGLGRFSGTPLSLESLAAAGEVYIELTIDGERMLPRQRVGSNVYACRAQYARVADDVEGTFAISSESLPGMSAGKTYGQIPKERIGGLSAAIISNASGTLNPDRLPLLPLSKLTTGVLPEEDIGSIDSAGIDAGTFGLSVLPAGLLTDERVGFDAGPIADGATIPIPAGFSSDQCAWLLSIASLDMHVGNDVYMADDLYVYSGGSVDTDSGPLATDTHCRTTYGSSGELPCTGYYLIVCVK